MEVNDFRNDVLLAEACRTDVDKYCKNVQPGIALPELLDHEGDQAEVHGAGQKFFNKTFCL